MKIKTEKITMRENVREEELFCALVLSNYLFETEDFTVGDDLELPDITSGNCSVGIEVVQIEKEVDHLQDRILKEFVANNLECIKVYKNKKILPKLSSFSIKEKDGKLMSLSTKEESHSVDWMMPENEERLRKKLKKLNRGNYSRIKENIALCVLSRDRIRNEYDFCLLIYQYLKIAAEFEKKYDAVYFITSEGIFCWKKTDEKYIAPRFNNGRVCGFDVGKGFPLEKTEYDYNEIHKTVHELLSQNKHKR